MSGPHEGTFLPGKQLGRRFVDVAYLVNRGWDYFQHDVQDYHGDACCGACHYAS